MTITLNEWAKYRDMLAKISNKAAEEYRDYFFHKNGARGGIGLRDADRNEVVSAAYTISQKYGEAGATLAAEFYDEIAAASGVALPSAVPAEVASYSEVAKTVNGAMKTSQQTQYVADVVGKIVKKASTDTIKQNSKRDKAEYAWIPNGDTCPYCLALASRGWQDASKDKSGDHLHAHCDCTYAVRFTKTGGVAGYDPNKYKDIYYDADGRTSKDKINAMRREQYAENKDEINKQKREAYELRKVEKIEPAVNKFGKEISFDFGKTAEKFNDSQNVLARLANEYNTRLEHVSLGAKQAAGDVDITGATMRLSDSHVNTAMHEFAHTLANSDADKYGLTNDAEFWKEVKKIRRDYLKNSADDPTKWISSYEHSQKNPDEFFAESFAQIKMREYGYELPNKYGKDTEYSQKLVDVVDKYFKK